MTNVLYGWTTMINLYPCFVLKRYLKYSNIKDNTKMEYKMDRWMFSNSRKQGTPETGTSNLQGYVQYGTWTLVSTLKREFKLIGKRMVQWNIGIAKNMKIFSKWETKVINIYYTHNAQEIPNPLYFIIHERNISRTQMQVITFKRDNNISAVLIHKKT